MIDDQEAMPKKAETASTQLPDAKGSIASDREIDPSNLTPEEQMARFEEQLKEDDWGHQPC